MKKEYIIIGKCIFCEKDFTEVSFYTRPHILPKSMGGDVIGYDICDECNHYFGSSDNLLFQPPKLAVEMCVKEVMNLSRFFLDRHHKKEKLKSVFFNYWNSKSTLQFKCKQWDTESFQLLFLRQFKRGVFEMFLQAYHKATGNGLDKRFDYIRFFSRYNKNDAHIYYIENRGIYFLEKDMSHPFMGMTESCLKDINEYGFYHLYLNGHNFLLEVIPQTEEKRNAFLNSMCEKLSIGGGVYKQIVELKYINQIDFTLRTLYR